MILNYLLIKRKIIFKKLATSLFKLISLKKVITEDKRFSDVFWKYLHYIYISYNKYNDMNADKIKLFNQK